MTASDMTSGAPSPVSGCPGFGEGAPLDLSGLTPAAEHAVVERLRDGSFDAWADTASKVGYCTNPVRLVGGSTGTAIWGAFALAGQMHREGRPGSIVTLICDGGERYLKTYYNDAWLAGAGIDLTPYRTALEAFLAGQVDDLPVLEQAYREEAVPASPPTAGAP